MGATNRQSIHESWHELYQNILNRFKAHPDQTSCVCAPTEVEKVRQLWANRGLRKVHHKFVGYVRAQDELSLDEQYERIEQFAKEHNLDLQETYCDVGVPQGGLSHALESLETTDGLIVCNLDRFVTHHDDRLRELRPLLHHFCCRGAKHLITIDEGIDTGTPNGQLAAVDIINQPKDLRD